MDSLRENRLQDTLYKVLCISGSRVAIGSLRSSSYTELHGDFREYVGEIQQCSETRQNGRKSRCLTSNDEKTHFWRKLGVECTCEGDEGFLLILIRAATPQKHSMRQLYDVRSLFTKCEGENTEKGTPSRLSSLRGLFVRMNSNAIGGLNCERKP